MEQFDSIVVGAGPAGCGVATRLAQLGQKVLLLEKGRIPCPRVCGGVLNARAWRAMSRLGVADAVMDLPIQPLRFMRIECKGSSPMDLPFPKSHWPVGVVDRNKMDEVLWLKATHSGVDVRSEMEFKTMKRAHPSGWDVWTTSFDGEPLRGMRVWGADGRHSRVARVLGLQPRYQGRTYCYQYHLDAHEFEPEGVHFLLFPEGYCGLSVNGHGVAHLDLLSLHGEKWSADQIHRMLDWDTHFTRCLRRCRFRPEPPEVRAPIGSGRRPTPTGSNVFLLGDAQNWYEPLTGEGITLAFESAWKASLSLISGDSYHPPTPSWTNAMTSRLLQYFGLTRSVISFLEKFPSLARSICDDVLG